MPPRTTSVFARVRPAAAVEWVLPGHVRRIVDLGAGTGGLTRRLVGRADEVVAVEPDDRMREVLQQAVPDARALAGRGESIPLEDGSADAVLRLVLVALDGARPHAARGRPGARAGRRARRDVERTRSAMPPSFSRHRRSWRATVPRRWVSSRRTWPPRSTIPTAPNQVLEIPPGVPFDQPEMHSGHLGRGSHRRRPGRASRNVQLGHPDGGGRAASGSSTPLGVCCARRSESRVT